MKITVDLIYGVFSRKEFVIECSPEDTLDKLLDLVREEVKGEPMDLRWKEDISFYYNDQKLDFEKTIGSYEITNGSTVILGVTVPDAG